MTQQEAEAYIERMALIWHVKGLTLVKLDLRVETPAVKIQVDERVEVYMSKPRYSLAYLDEGRSIVAKLFCRVSTGEVTAQEKIIGTDDTNTNGPITTQWMPFFRRGCWLSGLPIEATAHEKAEWMQDFTREEIESWNLQF